MNENYIIANQTDVGRVRQVNEDSMVTFDSPNGRVIAVCDGMGGQAAGDVASKLACQIIKDILTDNTFGTPTEAITRACLAANQAILHKASQDPGLEGMGATCVMVVIKDGLVYYGWVGDSRIYYISNGHIRQLTRDQSYVQQLVDQGTITAAQAEHHPQKNQILNALGMPGMNPPELCTAPLTPEPGSVILLCSDGLSGMVDDETIKDIVSASDLSLQSRASKLIDRALANGGNDNVTVQLIQFEGRTTANSPQPPMMAAPKRKSGQSMLWMLIVGIVVIVGLVFAWIFIGGEEQKEADNQQQKTEQRTERPTADNDKEKEDNSNSKKSKDSGKQTTTNNNVTTKTVTRTEKPTGTQKKENSKDQPNIGGTTGKASEGTKENVDNRINNKEQKPESKTPQNSVEDFMQQKPGHKSDKKPDPELLNL